MAKPVRKRLTFDTVRQSQAVYVTVDTSPQVILDSLGLYPLPSGIISISGGAKEFPPAAVKRTKALMEQVIVPIVYERNLLIVDGGTEAGVMKITGEVFQAKYPVHTIIGKRNSTTPKSIERHNLPLLGIVPEPRVRYPGIECLSERDCGLDPNHFYFVLVRDAKDWGEEVDCMFSFLDYLAVCKQVPIVIIIANGGRITIKEAFHAVERDWPVVVFEGSHRATETIVAALNGASREDLFDMFDMCEIKVYEHEIEETLDWLNSIAQYERITRFDFISGSPEELREAILSGLGFDAVKSEGIEPGGH